MEKKFVIFETIEDDGSITEEVVEVFELVDTDEWTKLIADEIG